MAKKVATPVTTTERIEVPRDLPNKPTVAVVKDSRGQTIRTYDLKIHGENFEGLAKMFQSHTPNSTIDVH
jgi:heme-binding NEAT domain protein